MESIKHRGMIVLGNMIPLVGSILFGWEARQILLFYIVELVIVELINGAKIGILTVSRERKITNMAASVAGAALLIIFHLAIFLLGLLFLLAIAFMASGYGIENYAVGNPMASILDFLISSWPAIVLLAVDRLRDFIFNFYKNKQYEKIDHSRYFKFSIIRQSATVIAAILFAFLFRRGVGNPVFFIGLVVILKSGAEILMGRRGARGRSS